MTLEQQARVELLRAKLALVLSELDELKADVRLEEDQFEDDFQDYLDTKENYVRLTNEEGEVVWIDIKIGEGDLDMPSNVFTTKPACHGECLNFFHADVEEDRLTAMVNDGMALTLGYTVEQLPDWAKGL